MLCQTSSNETPKDLLGPAALPAGGKFGLQWKAISEECSTQLCHGELDKENKHASQKVIFVCILLVLHLKLIKGR